MKEYYFITLYDNFSHRSYSLSIYMHPFEWVENNIHPPEKNNGDLILIGFQKITKEEYDVWVAMEEKRVYLT